MFNSKVITPTNRVIVLDFGFKLTSGGLQVGFIKSNKTFKELGLFHKNP